jgi:hypothetical protein
LRCCHLLAETRVSRGAWGAFPADGSQCVALRRAHRVFFSIFRPRVPRAGDWLRSLGVAVDSPPHS